MKKENLIRHPECFQGKKKLQSSQPYFEGWYFKHSGKETSLAVICGIHLEKEKREAFIQIIIPQASYYIPYNFDDFRFFEKPFCIQIQKNIFSLQGLHLEIEDQNQDLYLHGDLVYSEIQTICPSFYAPNIMGPFSYLPWMECNHAILSMKHQTEGMIQWNQNFLLFDQAAGYIEKDWGSSFPSSYLWCQGNDFRHFDASFMISIARIPMSSFHFTGLICVLIFQDQEFRFATYNGAKVFKLEIESHELQIVLKKDPFWLKIRVFFAPGQNLRAPVRGKMEKVITESIAAEIEITLKKGKQVLFSDTSQNCGLEIVRE